LGVFEDTFPGHLAVGDLITREILGGELGAIDGGGEVIIVGRCFNVELPDLLGEVVIAFVGLGNVAEVYHVGWLEEEEREHRDSASGRSASERARGNDPRLVLDFGTR
jgi:hypothetical protein